MRGADRVVVNSKFTKGVVEGVWPRLREVGVVYPCVDTRGADSDDVEEKSELWKGKKILLSINRFEGKKNIELAIRAFARLSETERKGARLVIAGIPLQSSILKMKNPANQTSNFNRWLRPPCPRERLLPHLPSYPNRLPQSPLRHRQDHHLGPLHPSPHLRPLPPLRTRRAESQPARRRNSARLHARARAFWYRAAGGHAGGGAGVGG